jgi:spermidine synthase
MRATRSETHHGKFGTVTIRHDTDGSTTMMQGGFIQSQVDPRGISLNSYIHALFGFLYPLGTGHAVILGCGGGTLGTMLSLAGWRVTMVDINALVFTLARRHFSLPATVACETDDGWMFLKRTRARYNAIVLDLFTGNRSPAYVHDPEFHRSIARRLTPAGLVVANVIVKNDLDPAADLLADAMTQAGFAPLILEERGDPDRNAIVVAGGLARPKAPRMIIPPMLDADIAMAELRQMRLRKPKPVL